MSELLARLNPKSQNWGVGGGYDGLTVADICAALADTETLGRLALMCRYGASMSELDFEALHIKVLRYAIKHNWSESPKDSKAKRIKKLTKLCLIEHCINPLCGTCKGTKWLYTKECPTCKGTGNGKYSTTDRANMLDISRRTYIRKWESKKKSLQDYFRDLLPEREYRAKREFHAKLA